MKSWILRRLGSSLILVFTLTSLVFFLVRLAPGDPLDQAASAEMTGADRELVRHRLGLDQPLWLQYGRWLSGVARWDWGTSLRQQRGVADILGEAVPATLLLTVVAFALHLALGIAAGVVMATSRDGAWGRAVKLAGLTLYSLPGFWFGLMLILVFSRWLGWLPAGGMSAPDAAFMSGPARFADLVRHLVLPVGVLVLGSFMSTARYVQASLEEALGQDYVLTARARGLAPARVLWGHALRNALLPVATQIGLYLPFLLGGAVVVEVVFGWPGMGRVTVEAIRARDYPVIMATTSLAASLVVLGSLLADVLYQALDPRIDLHGRRRRSP